MRIIWLEDEAEVLRLNDICEDDADEVEDVDAEDEKDEHSEADDEDDDDEDLVLRLLFNDVFIKETEVSISDAISDGDKFGDAGNVVSELDPSECAEIDRGDIYAVLEQCFRLREAFPFLSGGNKAGYNNRILSDGILLNGTSFIFEYLLSGIHSSSKL